MPLQTKNEDCRTPQVSHLYKRAAGQISEALMQPSKKLMGEGSLKIMGFFPVTISCLFLHWQVGKVTAQIQFICQRDIFYHTFAELAIPTPRTHHQSISPWDTVLSLPWLPSENWDSLCPCYLKHPHFPPRYSACMACMYYILVISSCSAPRRVTALKRWLPPWCLDQPDLQPLSSSSHMPWEHWVSCRGTACYLHAHLACDNPRQNHSDQTRLFLRVLGLFPSPFQSSAQFPALSLKIFDFCRGADRQTGLSWS